MRIVYEDRDVLVVYKEAGLAVQSRRVGEMDLECMLRNMLALRDGEAAARELYVVHRLDQPVSGLLAFARTRAAAASLSAQVQDGRMKKIYHARVAGRIPSDEGILEDYLVRSPGGRGMQAVDKRPLPKDAKLARLAYRRIGEDLLEIELFTGRYHQIRVQLAHAGMPILGDRRYGNGEGAEELQLRAVHLSFLHPRTGKRLEFSCEG